MEAPPFAGRHVPAAGYADGWPTMLAGIFFPMFTIGFELLSRLCAEALFDPLPTLAHLALVVAVPTLNLKLWWMRRRELEVGRGWLIAAGIALAVSLNYSLLFLPIYPIAALGILYFGMGLLVFAPLLSGIGTLVIVRDIARERQIRPARPITAGMLVGLATLLALDIPTAITGYAVRSMGSSDPEIRERAVSIMRRFGDRELLLQYCYGQNRRGGGLLTLILEGGSRFLPNGEAGSFSSPRLASELHYRVTGFSHDNVTPSLRGGRWGFTQQFNWDRDFGGTQVGATLAGLSLASSRIDASMDADDAVAYVEWTAEFENTLSWGDREARMTMVLPPGGVISRATLWVNGEEREAVFASRAETTAAYQAVVTRRQDPLLVTTNGADQVMARMFPVPAGGRAKIRLGITAPLALSADDRATLVLPAIADRNFSIGGDLRHAVWVEGDGREAKADAAFTTVPGGAVVRRRASFTDTDLATRRPRISLSRNPKAESMTSGEVLQTILREPREPAGSLFVVLDGSVRAARVRKGFVDALERIPLGARVGFGIASATPAILPLSPWTPMRRAELIELLNAQPFNGGEDNVGVLTTGLSQLEDEPRATLLWVHAPQGHEFKNHAAALEQVMDRGVRLPELWLLPVEPGPNKVLNEDRLFAQARTLAWTDDASEDISRAIADYFDTAPRWTVRRVRGSSQGVPSGSMHVEKLWALQEIEDLLARRPAARAQAIEIAARYQLVTPVSGAVVLENDDQYRNAGLTPPGASAVPTIPEPETWALLIIACLVFAWFWRRRQLASA